MLRQQFQSFNGNGGGVVGRTHWDGCVGILLSENVSRLVDEAITYTGRRLSSVRRAAPPCSGFGGFLRARNPGPWARVRKRDGRGITDNDSIGVSVPQFDRCPLCGHHTIIS